jgi:hypothetical protein
VTVVVESLEMEVTMMIPTLGMLVLVEDTIAVELIPLDVVVESGVGI